MVKSQKSPLASASPRKSPTTEASVPIARDSISTENRTWRRDAPSVRSVANSRVRCAIVIEREFAITKAPTKSAIPAKPRRNFCRKFRKPLTSSASFVACASPLLTCVPLGRIVRTLAISSACETPAFFAIRIWSSLPSLSNSDCATGRSNPASVAPPIDDTAPYLAIPEIRNFSTGPRDWIPIIWPTVKCSLPAVDLSTMTSPAFGQAPSARVSELNCG